MIIDRDFLLVIKGATLGEGPVDLGEKLIDSYFKVLLESEKLPARVVFLNSGIVLTTEGSTIGATLKKLEEKGSEILSCTTCLEYFGRKEKLIVGKPTTMAEIIRGMESFNKVILL
jgi:selenium metabolism protein YedF